MAIGRNVPQGTLSLAVKYYSLQQLWGVVSCKPVLSEQHLFSLQTIRETNNVFSKC